MSKSQNGWFSALIYSCQKLGIDLPLLMLNIIVAAFFLKVSDIFSQPIIILPLALLYSFELFFLPQRSLWPTILCLDIFCGFLLFKNVHQDMADYMIMFLGVFHLVLILEYPKNLFLILLCSGILSFILYEISIQSFSEAPDILIPWMGLAYWYRKGLYQSKWGKNLMFLPIVATIIIFINACFARGSDHITDIPLAALEFLTITSLAFGFYPDGNRKRVLALLGFIEFIFIAFIFYRYPHILVFITQATKVH